VRLFCTNGTPVRKTLDSWPNLPIVMQYGIFRGPNPNPLASADEDDIVAALQNLGRIWKIQLTLTTSLSEKLVTKTQGRFPDLELLDLTTQSETGLTLPHQFLSGGAPRLHILRMVKIALPALPQLLLSAQNLVSLQLEAIPSSGYIPPDVLVNSLSGMTRLQMFHIHFLSPNSHLVARRPIQLSPGPVSLPSLKHFEFHGVKEYLECLLSGINAPVRYLYITLLYDLDFRNLSQLQRFIGRTETQGLPDEASIFYSMTGISITFAQAGTPHRLGLRISCRRFGWQMASLAEVCSQLQPPATLSTVRRLDIYASPPVPDEHDDLQYSPLLELNLFRAVETLHVTRDVGSHVALALQGSLVLPSLRAIFLEEQAEFTSVERALAPFIAARRRTGSPVTLHLWEPCNDPHSLMYRPSSEQTHTPAPFIQRNDPVLMLEEEVRQKFEHRVSPNPIPVQALYQRAQSFLLSFTRKRSENTLRHSIDITKDLLEMRPRQIRRLKLFRMLAFCFALGNHIPEHRNESVSMFGDSFQEESATATEKLRIAWWWATFARSWGHSSTSLAYQNTLSALQYSLSGAFTIERQPATIDRLGMKIHIPLEYASYQIETGQLESAVETIEQGKMLIWDEIYGLRTFVGRIRRFNPDLAERLATVNQDLVDVNALILAHKDAGSQLDEEGDHEHMDNFNPLVKKRRWLLRERQDLTAMVKTLPGFENFMESVPFRTLQHAASRGPIIIINHCTWRCDILIVLHNAPPSLIPTTDAFYERASTLASTLMDARRNYKVESEQYQQELRSILKELHERVGQPVIDRLRELGVPEQSRVWWYPTSVFCSLPLHAMGPVTSTDGKGQYFSDLYICSYTPTLAALIAARTAAAPISNPGPTLLFVGRPIASPLGTRDMKVIRSIGVPTTRLVFGNATRDAVINGLKKHRLAHFARGSHRERGKPFDTAIELDGGDRLSLLDIVRCQVPTTEVAVLAGSGTAELPVVEGTDFVEGFHLTAAMQYYGFGSVVGTMWDLGDGGAQDLSLGFYKEMLSEGEEDGVSVAERSARALQYTVQRLREKRVTLQRWANWVHYGL
jgi:CHAT domain-containing protein